MIVVTGASGVIGRAVMTQLRLTGVEAVGIRREVFNLASGESLTNFIGQKPEGIIHLAAAVPHSERYPDTESSANITRMVDKTVFDAARKWDCRVVYASTCSLYNKRDSSIKFENTALYVRPDSPYMASKYKGEKLFSTLDSYMILRIPAPIGPGLPEKVVAKRFLKQAIAGQTIRVWGTGSREQNYVDVSDMADIFLRAAISLSTGIVNVAANEPTTMLELAATVVKIVNCGSFEVADIPDPLEPEYTRYSNARAFELLGWVPKVPLNDAIRTMYEAEHETG